MGRWEPDAAGRLRMAAMELYLERGFDQTTVADIAERAGLTARTFFRHFADKREVLFAGSKKLEEHLVQAVAAAPVGASPMEAVAAGLDAAAEFLGGNRGYSQQRQGVIAATAELRERELIKMASLSLALAGALRNRGVADPDASLAAEAGIAVLRVAFARWLTETLARSLAEVMRESLQQLRSLTGASPGGRGPSSATGNDRYTESRYAPQDLAERQVTAPPEGRLPVLASSFRPGP